MDPISLLSFGLIGLAILSEEDEEVSFEVTRVKQIPEGFTTDARSFFEDYEVWREVADELWHVTTNLPAVLEEGLKSRNEAKSAGLGGGASNEAAGKVSLTFSRESAERIYEAMRLSAEVCREKILAADMVLAVLEQNSELLGIMEEVEAPEIDQIWEAVGCKHAWELKIHDAAKKVEEKHETPEKKYDLLQKIEKVLAEWHYRNSSLFDNAETPPTQPVGFTSSFESFKEVNPKKIGIVLVAAKIGSKPERVEHERELRFWPKDVFVVNGERPLWKYETKVGKKNDWRIWSEEEGLATAIWAWKLSREKASGSRAKRLPRPTRFIACGSNGFVFETEDPDVVVRVGEYQPYFEDEALMKSKGIVKTFATIPVIDKMLYVCWREKVDTGVESFILRRFHGKEADSILMALMRLYSGVPEYSKILKGRKETNGLWRAIFEHGLPTYDLSLEQNLGVTKEGRVVAYDY